MPRISRHLCLLVCVCLLGFTVPAQAEDRSAAQFANLFLQSCVRFAGDAEKLRGWATANRLGPMRTDLAPGFNDGRPGAAFVADSPDGRFALVSDDLGSCRVVIEKASAAGVEAAVLAVLRANGVTSILAGRQEQDGRAQALYRASLGARYWLLSINARPHPEAPGAPPTIILLASPASAQSPQEELTGSTGCTTYLRLMEEDMQPGADTDIARRHVASLMQTYAKYILRGPDGKPIPTIFDFIISQSSQYCRANPSGTVADAGEAVGAAERAALAKPPAR